MKADEIQLLQKLTERGGVMTPSAWEIAQSIGMPYKRARYILQNKWICKGWYEYGVSWGTGWLTEEAPPVHVL